jgi:hypothetical protein
VLQALLGQLIFDDSPFRNQSDATKALAAAVLDEAHCAGAHGLSETYKTRLNEIAAQARRPHQSRDAKFPRGSSFETEASPAPQDEGRFTATRGTL